MNGIKKAVIVVSIILSPVVILLAIFFLRVFVIRTVVVDEYSLDNNYRVVISEIGQAKWPFGSSTCQVKLKKGTHTISNTEIILDTDGGAAESQFFKVNWGEQYAIVDVSLMLNLPDQEFLLYYSGDVVQRDYTIDALEGIFKSTFGSTFLEFENKTVKKKTLSEEQTGRFEVHGFKYVRLKFQGPAVVYRYDENTNTLTNVHLETDVLYKSDINE